MTDSLPARMADLAAEPVPTVELGPDVRAELNWLASDAFWDLLSARLDRITAEVWGEVTTDDDH